MVAYTFSQPWLAIGTDPKQSASAKEWAHLLAYLKGIDSGYTPLFNPHLQNGTIDSLTAGGNINMNGFKLTSLAAGTGNGDSLRYEQLIGLYLLLTGGTMSGAIAMGSNKITGLANGTASTDAAAFGQIKVLQTVQATFTTQTSTTSSTFNSAGYSVTITPTSSSNRVLLWFSGTASTSSSTNAGEAQFARGSTLLGGSEGMTIWQPPSSALIRVPISIVYVDSPATTSATTYNVYFRSNDNATGVTMGVTNLQSNMVAMEVV